MSSTPGTAPAELARDAFRQLAARRVPPTPENYARVYAERAGKPLAEVQPSIGLLESLLELLHADPASATLARTIDDAIEHSDWKTARTSLKMVMEKVLARPRDPLGATRPVPTGSGLAPPGPAAAAAGNPAATQANPVQRGPVDPSAPNAPGGTTGPAAPGVTSGPNPTGGASGATSGPSAPPGSTAAFATVSAPIAGSGRAGAGMTGAFRTAGADPAGPVLFAGSDEVAAALKGLVGRITSYFVDVELGYSRETVGQADALVEQVKAAVTPEEVSTASSRLRHFWIDLELRGEGPRQMLRCLQNLLQVLMQNLGDLVADDRWVHGQVQQIQGLLSGPLSPALLAQAERSFKEYVLRQGTLKHSLDEARAAIRDMMAALVAQLAGLTTATGGYTEKIAGYSARIRSAQDLAGVTEVLGSLLADTRTMHTDITRSHGELSDTQNRVKAYEERVRLLEDELADLSQRIGEDPLTQALNRRGLDQQYAVEEARANRKQVPLCLSVLDIDNFKQLNDQLGHAAGDGALKHLVEVVRQVIRPTDSLARWGGEEFVILLPETALDDAEKVMIRVQRELTRRFFMHNNERVLITFSAGVVERRAGESQAQLIDRADQAMYRAKQAGKNRVERAN